MPPSKYLYPVCGLVALHLAWTVAGALLPFFVLTVASKAAALCGVVQPSPPLWGVLVLLCTTTLRYSSLMFQDPQGTSVKAREFPLLALCASSPSVLCCRLAPSASLLRVGSSLCWCLRPAPAAPPVFIPCLFVLPLPWLMFVPVPSPVLLGFRSTEALETSMLL